MANVYAGVFPSTTIPSLNQVQNGGYSTSCATNSCTLNVEQTLTDGNHSLWYVAKDKAGNVLGPSKLSGHFLVDTVGPSSTTPYFAANITNQTSMNLLWLASQDSNSGLAGYVLNVTQASTSTVTTYNLGPTTSQNITGLSDGNYSACLTPVDEADNYGQASCTTTSLWVDTTAPTLQAWSDVAGWTTSTRVNVSWEAYDSSQTTEVRYNLDSSGFSQAFSENDTVMLSSLSVACTMCWSAPTTAPATHRKCWSRLGSMWQVPRLLLPTTSGRCGPTKRSTPSPGTSPTPTAASNVFHSTKAGPSSLRT